MGSHKVSSRGSGQVGQAVITTEEALAEIEKLSENNYRSDRDRPEVKKVLAKAVEKGIGTTALQPVISRLLGRNVTRSTVSHWLGLARREGMRL